MRHLLSTYLFRRYGPLLLIALFGSFQGGCATVGSYESARTLAKGKRQFEVRTQLAGAVLSEEGVGVLPVLDLKWRRGMSDSVDFGFKVGTSGASWDVKKQVYRKEIAALAVNPTVGAFYIGPPFGASVRVLEIAVPVIFGFLMKEGTEWMVAPKLIGRLASVEGDNDITGGKAMIVGLSVGLRQRLTPIFLINPEVSMGYPLLGSSTLSGDDLRYLPEGFLFNVGIGIAFGRATTQPGYGKGDSGPY